MFLTPDRGSRILCEELAEPPDDHAQSNVPAYRPTLDVRRHVAVKSKFGLPSDPNFA